MSVIGDLFVRLGLKSDDYKKGMKDAQKETNTFGGKLKNMKAGAVAVWAAIGTAVVKFGQEVLKATNRVGDAWEKMTAGMKAGWSTFVKALSNFDFNGFVAKFQSATNAAKELQSVLDAQYEAGNSIRLQKALMSEELEALRVAMRDQTKTYKERLAAAETYMKKIKPIYEQETQLAKDLMDAQMGKWLAGTDLQDNEATRKDLMKFLVDYSSVKNRTMVEDASAYLTVLKEIKAYESLSRQGAFESSFASRDDGYLASKRSQEAALKTKLAQWGKDNGYTNFIGDLAHVYENWRGDADTQPLVDAIVAAEAAKGNLDRETARIQTLINSYKAAIQKENEAAELAKMELADKVIKVRENTLEMLAKDSAAMDEAISQMSAELFDIDFDIDLTDALSLVEAEMDSFINEFARDIEEIQALNEVLSYAIADGITGGVESLVTSLFDLKNADASQILSALVQPFADSAIQLGGMLIAQGVAIEAFKTSLASLQGFAAIAAGTALVAAGAAMKAGIQALANKGGSATAATTAYDSSNYTGGYETFESNITVEVVGKISGSDIVIAGSKQLNKWGR